jgi:hypothetical protein
MSIETYERKMVLVEMYNKLAEAEKQISDGTPLLDGKEVFKKMRQRAVYVES